MADVFEGRDLSGSVFWGVNLRGSTFRDADLSDSRFFHTLWSNVSIDGVVNGLVVNGVDVTDFVNEHDRWYPLRTRLEPVTAAELRSSWTALQDLWATLLERISALPPDMAFRSVNGEWSARDTLRHLIFAMDKWFTWPILGAREFAAIGLPNTESQGRDWPGLDPHADPTFETVLAVRTERIARFTDFISDMKLDDLPEVAEVLENGSVPALMCFHVVLEEEFEHLRYLERDLDTVVR